MLTGTWDGTQCPVRHTGPQEPWTVWDPYRSDYVSIKWESHPRLRGHSSGLIFHIRHLMWLESWHWRSSCSTCWPMTFPSIVTSTSWKEEEMVWLKPALWIWAMRSQLFHVCILLNPTPHVYIYILFIIWTITTELYWHRSSHVCISNALCETVHVPPLSVKCRVSVLGQQDGAVMCRPELGLCGAQILLTEGFPD